MTLKEAIGRRPEYLFGNITHQDYYETIGECLNISQQDLPCSLETVRLALDNGDVHLNTIPLWKWDERDCLVRIRVGPQHHRDFSWSLSDSVCTLKAAAKKLAKS